MRLVAVLDEAFFDAADFLATRVVLTAAVRLALAFVLTFFAHPADFPLVFLVDVERRPLEFDCVLVFFVAIA